MIVLTEKELADIKQGLVIAMKALDEFTDNNADKALSDRLEVIFDKLSEIN